MSNFSLSMARISYIFSIHQTLKHWKIFPKGKIILSGFLLLISNTKSMIMILLAMIGGRLLMINLMSSTLFITTLLVGCIRPNLQIPCQLQQIYPSNHTLQLITLRYPSRSTLHCFLSFNNRTCRTIAIAIALQLPVLRILREFLIILMLHQILITLNYTVVKKYIYVLSFC